VRLHDRSSVRFLLNVLIVPRVRYQRNMDSFSA
jgi:hypothetical protein